jgi:hypothetical protein
MFEMDVVLTGLPRSGTTLTCSLLNKLPDTVALHEPMQGIDYGDVSDPRQMSQTVKQFFDEQRTLIRERGMARSRNINGVVPDNPFGNDLLDTGARHKPLSDHYMIVIKHTNRFAQILESLSEVFPVYALVRNPLSTLASWGTVDAGIRRGRPGPVGRIAPAVRERMNRFDDELDRQICLLDWFFDQFNRYLPTQSIIKYESLVASGGRELRVIRPEAEQLDEPLQSRNMNKLYDPGAMVQIGERLLRTEGAYWELYTRQSVEQLLDELQPNTPT